MGAPILHAHNDVLTMSSQRYGRCIDVETTLYAYRVMVPNFMITLKRRRFNDMDVV